MLQRWKNRILMTEPTRKNHRKLSVTQLVQTILPTSLLWTTVANIVIICVEIIGVMAGRYAHSGKLAK